MNYRLETVKHPSSQLLIETIVARKWDDAASIVYNDGMFARIKDKAGYLPLHLSVKFGCTNELLHRLLAAYVEAASIRDPEGTLPIHLAAKHGQAKLWMKTNENFKSICDAFPYGTASFDEAGNLPIHIAIKNRTPSEIPRHLLKLYSESVSIRDKYGNLPLHLSLQYSLSDELVIQLLSMYPVAASLPNDQGLLPFHISCLFHTPLELMKSVLDSFPDAIKQKDKFGNTPTHLYYLRLDGAPNEEVLRFLLATYPNVLGHQNNSGYTPFMMMNCPEECRLEYFVR